MGRKLEMGENVFIDDERVEIKARVRKILSFSSHSDSSKLKKWVLKTRAKKVFINHGEDEERSSFKKSLEGKIENIILPVIEEKYLL